MWNPWKTHWAVALVKGIREPHLEKKKIILTLVGIEPMTSGLDLLLQLIKTIKKLDPYHVWLVFVYICICSLFYWYILIVLGM